MPKRIPGDERLRIYQAWCVTGCDDSDEVIESIAKHFSHDPRTVRNICLEEAEREKILLERQLMDSGSPDIEILKKMAWISLIRSVKKGDAWAVRAVINDELQTKVKDDSKDNEGKTVDPSGAFS